MAKRLYKLQSQDEVLNRIQDQLLAALNPILARDGASVLRTATATPIVVTASDDVIIVKLFRAGTAMVGLPSFSPIGKILTIKDGKGDAATNPVTIQSGINNLIDGASTKVIDTNFGFFRLVFDGINWLTI